MIIEISVNENYISAFYEPKHPALLNSVYKEKSFKFLCHFDGKKHEIILESFIGYDYVIDVSTNGSGHVPQLIKECGFGLYERLARAKSYLFDLPSQDNTFNRKVIEEFIEQKIIRWKSALSMPYIQIMATYDDEIKNFVPPYRLKQKIKLPRFSRPLL